MESTSKKKAKVEDPQADTSSSSRAVVDNLPNQILMEILSRLPLRTLMATRCVCKSWLLLTLDTDFAKLHSTRAPTELLRHHFNTKDRFFSTYLALGEFEMQKNSVFKAHFNFLFELPRFNVGPDNGVKFGDRDTHPVSLVNSCHGFLCYRGLFNTFAVIWNPFMGQFFIVPAPTKEGNVLDCTNYGFGFSSKENKFKLLRMLRVKDPVIGLVSSIDMAEVLTFEEGSLSWRNVGYCPYSFKEAIPGPFVEGAIHWVIQVHTYHIVIVSFDFYSEKFGNVPLPSRLSEVGKNRLKIGLLWGCLSLTDSFGDHIHIWVMKEYGVRNSWTKAFSIKKESRYREIDYGFELVKYLDNGEIVMLTPTRYLFAYHPDKERFRSLGRDRYCAFDTITYTPSLFRIEDAMMRNHVYTLNVKIRPVLKIYRSLIAYDHGDPNKYWRLSEENSAEHLTLPERSKAPSHSKKKQSSEELREELRTEQKELVEILQQKKSRIEQLKEQIKQIEQGEEETSFDELLS